MNKSDSIKELALALHKAHTKIKAAIKDSANPFFKSKYADLSSDRINDYVFDLSPCTTQTSPADPSMVIQYGVSIQSSSGMTADGGVNPMNPTATVIYIDSFWLEGSCSDGGTAGSGSLTPESSGLPAIGSPVLVSMNGSRYFSWQAVQTS